MASPAATPAAAEIATPMISAFMAASYADLR
jgi:hypothetical protein